MEIQNNNKGYLQDYSDDSGIDNYDIDEILNKCNGKKYDFINNCDDFQEPPKCKNCNENRLERYYECENGCFVYSCSDCFENKVVLCSCGKEYELVDVLRTIPGISSTESEIFGYNDFDNDNGQEWYKNKIDKMFKDTLFYNLYKYKLFYLNHYYLTNNTDYNDEEYITSISETFYTDTISICFNDRDIPLRRLKPNLYMLNIIHSKLEILPRLNSNLKILNLSNCYLNLLPELPDSLEFINIENNPIVKLPKLPRNLKYLFSSGLLLETFPTLPNRLLYLDISYCFSLEYITSFPESLIYIKMVELDIKNCPDFPYNLQYLDISYNEFDIPKLPSSLNILKIVGLDSYYLPEIPERCIYHFNSTNNENWCGSDENYQPKLFGYNTFNLNQNIKIYSLIRTGIRVFNALISFQTICRNRLMNPNHPYCIKKNNKMFEVYESCVNN